MNIVFYKISDDKRTVSKNVTNSTKITELTGTFKDDCDILNPIITVSYSASLLNANYCYISDFGRYYFLKPPTLSTNRMIFDASIDVLMSHKTQLLNLECVIARQEDKEYHSNRYLNDGMFRALQPKNVLTFNFPNGFSTDGSFVLSVGGHS